MSNVSLPTETSQGRAWVEKYLHPPSVTKSDFVACPDNNLNPVTTLNFETITNIPLSCTIGATIHPIDEVFFLQTTGARVISFVFVRSIGFNGGEWFQHPQQPAILNDSYNFLSNWDSDVSMQRMSYKSCTYYLNSTAFNDQGTVTIAQTRPDIYNFITSALPPLPPPPPPTTDVFQPTPYDHVDIDFDNVHFVRRLNGEFDYNAQVIDLGDISGASNSGAYVPSTPTQIQQSSPRAVTHLARQGAFVPQHWSQPINRFYNNDDNGTGSTNSLIQTFVRFTTSDRSQHTVRLYLKNQADGNIPVVDTLDNCADTTWSDFTFSFVYFSALSTQPALSTILISPAYITVKSIYGIEVQPRVKSSLVFFQENSPIPDDRALHVAAAIVHQKPDGFPSSANDFGSILGLVTTFAPKVFDWLSHAFSKPAVPTIAPVRRKKASRIPTRNGTARPLPAVRNDSSKQLAQLTRAVNNMTLMRNAPVRAKQRRVRVDKSLIVPRANYQAALNRVQNVKLANTSRIPRPSGIPTIKTNLPKKFSNRL